MINADGSVVFTKMEAMAMGIDPGELSSLKPKEFIKIPKRRGRPSVAFAAESIKEVIESRSKIRKQKFEAAMKALMTD